MSRISEKILYNDVPFARDLASDCDVTITVTCRISSNTNATDSILVSILTIFEVEELENKKGNDVPLAPDLESDCDVTLSVTFRI